MALRPCKSCKHQIDTKAKTCPSCGVSEPGVTAGQKALGALIILVIIFVAVKSCGGRSEKTVSVEQSPTAAEIAVVKTLGITPEQYADRLDALVGKLNKPYTMSNAEFEAGQVNDAFSAKLGPYVSLVGSISKSTGELLELMVVIAGDGTPQSGVDIVLTASAALAATTPDANYKAVLDKMNSISDGSPEVFGDVKISFSETPGLAMWFTASPI